MIWPWTTVYKIQSFGGEGWFENEKHFAFLYDIADCEAVSTIILCRRVSGPAILAWLNQTLTVKETWLEIKLKHSAYVKTVRPPHVMASAWLTLSPAIRTMEFEVALGPRQCATVEWLADLSGLRALPEEIASRIRDRLDVSPQMIKKLASFKN